MAAGPLVLPFTAFTDRFSCMAGDRIEMKRRGYKHWAICVVGGRGDEIKIVHVTSNSDTASGSSWAFSRGTTGVIKEEYLKSVTKSSTLRVNNESLKDWPSPALEPDAIVMEAQKRIGEQVNYNLVAYNCETFVNEARYGLAVSEQARRFLRRSHRIAIRHQYSPF